MKVICWPLNFCHVKNRCKIYPKSGKEKKGINIKRIMRSIRDKIVH